MQPFPVCPGQGSVNCLCVKKITGFILLIAFTVSQYAKQAAYFECRLSNYFSTETGKCDCERILSNSDNPANSLPLSLRHNHLHIDDAYYPCEANMGQILSFTIIQELAGLTSRFLPNGFLFAIDRPPQLG